MEDGIVESDSVEDVEDRGECGDIEERGKGGRDEERTVRGINRPPMWKVHGEGRRRDYMTKFLS